MHRVPSHLRELQLLRSIAGKRFFGRYVLIGASGLGVDLGIFMLLVLLGVAPIPANALSSILGMANNYMLNARLNFGQKLSASAGLRFFSVGLIGLALTTVSLHFLMLAGMSALMAKVFILPVLLVAQFLGNRAWTFKEVRQKTTREVPNPKEL